MTEGPPPDPVGWVVYVLLGVLVLGSLGYCLVKWGLLPLLQEGV